MTLPALTFLLSALFTFFTFLCQRHHLLVALLTLELTLLLLTSALTISPFHPGPLLIPVILTIAACEAAVGLTILITLVRRKGNDLIFVLSPSTL